MEIEEISQRMISREPMFTFFSKKIKKDPQKGTCKDNSILEKNFFVPGRGLEPPWILLRQLLRLVRLPFRHPGFTYSKNLTRALQKKQLYQ